MKQYLLGLAFSLALAPAFAQTQTGTTFIGTHLGGSIKRDDPAVTTTEFKLSPTVGHFISDNWMIGLQGQVGMSRTEGNKMSTSTTNGYATYYTSMGSSRTQSFSLGPVARYYRSMGDKFAVFAETGAGYAQSTTRAYISETYVLPGSTQQSGTGQPLGTFYGAPVASEETHNAPENTSLYSNAAAGLTYFPSSKIGIELKVNMLSYAFDYNKGAAELDANFSLAKASFGAGFFIGR